MTTGWNKTSSVLPEIGEIVDTKIDDENGVKNEAKLKRGGAGSLWFTPDGGMYVYYRPTHWRRA